MTLEEQIQKLTAEASDQREIASKYEDRFFQAKALLEQTTAERDAARADLKAIGECVGGEPLAVRGLVEYMDAAIKERDAALKACAEMRGVLKEVEWRGSGDLEIMRDHFFCPICHAHGADCDRLPHDPECQLQHALSTDCGKGYVKTESLRCFKCDDGHTPLYCLNCAWEGYHHNDEWKMVVEALKRISNFPFHVEPVGTLMDIVEISEQALAHAERLTSQ